MTITEKQNALFEELRKTVPEAVLDGVVEEGEYCSAPIRLMVVLKEVNGKTVLDLCDFLRKGGRPQTWDNIVRWTEGICQSLLSGSAFGVETDDPRNLVF